MIPCPHCNAPVRPETTICPSCGQPIRDPTPTDASAFEGLRTLYGLPDQDFPLQPAYGLPITDSRRWVPLLVGAAIAMVIGAGIAWMAMS